MTNSTPAAESRRARPGGRARRVRARAAYALVSLLVLVAGPAAADLVVFDDGHFLHVDSYRAENGRARLELPSGGVMTLPLHRIERVVDDAPAAEPEPAEAAPFGLRFRDDHPVPGVPYGELIHRAARRHGMNPQFVAAVMRAESAYRADAVSPKGARGLMQLMPATAARFGLAAADIHDPARNLDAGIRYLRVLADRFDDDLDLVLAAYNAGEGTVSRYGGVPPYRETRRYLARIHRFLGVGESAVERSGGVAVASSR